MRVGEGGGKVAGCSLLFKPANNTQGKLLPQLSHS